MRRLYTESVGWSVGQLVDEDRDAVPATGAVRSRARSELLLERPVAVSRPDRDLVTPLRGIPRVHPLDPCRVRDRGRELGVPPLPVDADLDPGDAPVGCPGDA